MGVLSILVPEDEGGLGLDEGALVGVLEAAGAVALPHPIVESAMVAAPLGVDVSSRLVTTTLGGRAACLLDADAVLVADGDRLVLVDDFEVDVVATVDAARSAYAERIDPGPAVYVGSYSGLWRLRGGEWSEFGEYLAVMQDDDPVGAFRLIDEMRRPQRAR